MCPQIFGPAQTISFHTTAILLNFWVNGIQRSLGEFGRLIWVICWCAALQDLLLDHPKASSKLNYHLSYSFFALAFPREQVNSLGVLAASSLGRIAIL